MELYTLDDQLRRKTITDQCDSLIWTERFNSLGDFQLTIESTPNNRQMFKEETWLALKGSYRCMKVETVEEKYDEDGRKMLNISGPSIESIMDDRVAFSIKDDLTTHPKWYQTGTPANIARSIFVNICITGILDTKDIIPFIVFGTLLPADTIPESTDVVTIEFEPDTVLNSVQQVCQLYDLGYRILRNFDNSELYFAIYAGNDRTSRQTTLPIVVFSPDMENLVNTKRLSTTAGAKNVAYVYSNLGYEEVIALDVDPNITGFQRKVLVLKVDDFDAATPPADVTASMQRQGREALAAARQFVGFDGEVTQDSTYTYGVDYQLGDLVELHDDDGNSSIVRVTEQIFVSDAEGDRSYPTLSNRSSFGPGSWAAQGDTEWIDYADDATTWYNMP